MSLSDIDYVCCVPEGLDLPKTVYKYRAVNDFLFSSLLLNRVWLASPSSFNDPFEPSRIFSDSRYAQTLDRGVREAGVLCLCKRNDNLPMWAYYGNALKGMAIGYDLAALVRDLEPVEPSPNDPSPRWRYVYDMAYRDDGLSQIKETALLGPREERDPEYQKMHATKASAFGHEEECRVVVPPSASNAPDHAYSGPGLYQHAPEAVKEIVFGELMTENDRQAIFKAMAGRAVGFFVAVRDRDGFHIQIQPASPVDPPSASMKATS